MSEAQGTVVPSGGSRSSSSNRRRRRPRPRRPRFGDKLRSPSVNRAVWAVMLLALAIFATISIKIFNDNSDTLGNVYFLGLTPNETLYTYGPAKRVRSAPGAPWIEANASVSAAAYPLWGYTAAGGGEVEIAFDPSSGRTIRVSCGDTQLGAASCPSQFDISIGDFEDWVAYQLGKPARQIYLGRDKLMVYPDLGLTFTLRELRVRQIEVAEKDRATFGAIGSYLRAVVP